MIQKWKERAARAALKTELALREFCENAASERGDTNFISILIILGIVVGLAAVFIGFKDQIVGKVQEMIEKFLGSF